MGDQYEKICLETSVTNMTSMGDKYDWHIWENKRTYDRTGPVGSTPRKGSCQLDKSDLSPEVWNIRHRQHDVNVDADVYVGIDVHITISVVVNNVGDDISQIGHRDVYEMFTFQVQQHQLEQWE